MRSIVVGYLLSGFYYFCRVGDGGQTFRVLSGSHVITAGGLTTLEAMPLKCLLSVSLGSVVMLLAATSGIGVVLMINRWRATRWLGVLIGWGARLVSALPVVGLAWCGISWLVTKADLPIESLIPYAPPPERDSRLLALGRAVWTWAVPVWVLVVPLAGLWVTSTLEALRFAASLPLDVSLTARGLSEEQSMWGHRLRLAWTSLHLRWLHLGMIVFAWLIFVEDVFGIPGWGGFVAHSIRTQSPEGIATALLAAGWMAALWHLISWPLRSRVPPATAQPCIPTTGHGNSSLWAAFMLLGVLVMAISLSSMESFLGVVMNSGMVNKLPSAVAVHVPAMWQALMTDLHMAGITACVAVPLMIVIGWGLALAGRVKAWPQMLIADTVLNGPLAASALIIAAAAAHTDQFWVWPAVALGIQGGTRLRDRAALLGSSTPMLASRIAGSGTLARWMRHAVPELVQDLCTLALHSIGSALLWIVLIRSLVPAGKASLGSVFAEARNTALTQPHIVLLATCLTALAVGCFWSLSRVLRAAHH